MTRSHEEDLNSYRDPYELEVNHLKYDDHNLAMELRAHHTHIMQYGKAAHNAWQWQYETYTSLIELAEVGTIARCTNQYIKANHI